MIIGVAGPYSAPTKAQQQLNLQQLNKAAAQLLLMGHVPLIGVNAALPVIEEAKPDNAYKACMDISLAVIGACQALLLLSESPGANKERDLILSLGRPVYYSINEVPAP